MGGAAKTHPCLDCKTPVNAASVRCWDCSVVHKAATGYRCGDCGIKVKRGSMRCRPCDIARRTVSATMCNHCGLPDHRGEAGIKLIRRSMATIARRRIGEANWRQGEMMLGHVKTSISDIYALPDPANLGLALAATEAIIDEIEAAAPGSYRTVTALRIVNGGRNG